MEKLTIGQLAQKSKIPVETIRYYERRGLIPKPERRESGYRIFSPDVIHRIQFIKHAQTLGFTLKEIMELLLLGTHANLSRTGVKKKVQSKIANVEEKIAALQNIKKALVHLSETCSGEGPTSQCPILEQLEFINIPLS